MGNVTAYTDCKGNDTTFTYDDIYRLIQIQYADQSTVDFTYDLNSNRTQMEDDAPNANDYVEYTYDYWNRLTSETRHITTSTYTVSYQYDTATRLTKLTYPDSMQILYSYDDLNRTTEIKRYVDGINDEVLMDGIQYDVDSLITQFDYGNDLQATFSYDARDRIATMDVKNGTTSYLDLDYTLDNNSNITQLVNGWRDTSSTWHSETESYSYDGLDRLTSASCTSWSHTYAYDKVGNRTSKDSVTYTINTVNEVTSLSDGTSFTYDANGNRTQKTKGTDTWAYTYDYANRLTRVEKNSSILGEYVYDGDGKRIQATQDSKTTTYIYSGVTVLYEETTTGTADYIYGPTGRLAKRTTINQQSNTYYYHTDYLGSTRLVTDGNKTIVTAVTFHPFGESSTQEGSEHYLFTGKEKDVTGLYYYGARYYDPEIGRFTTRDTWPGSIQDPQSLNRHTYCYNNPLKYVDQWGNFACLGGLVLTLGAIPLWGWAALAIIGLGLLACYVYFEFLDVKNWKDYGLPKDIDVGEGKVEIWDKDRYDPDRNKLVIHINKDTGEAREIIVIIEKQKQWTYWKEGDTWYKHSKDDKTPQEVTDQDEIDWINEVTKYAEEQWDEEYGKESGKDEGSSGGEDSSGGNHKGPPQPV
jgi:RHS repeat-associated protein